MTASLRATVAEAVSLGELGSSQLALKMQSRMQACKRRADVLCVARCEEHPTAPHYAGTGCINFALNGFFYNFISMRRASLQCSRRGTNLNDK
jgi:hypothetical protein